MRSKSSRLLSVHSTRLLAMGCWRSAGWRACLIAPLVRSPDCLRKKNSWSVEKRKGQKFKSLPPTSFAVVELQRPVLYEVGITVKLRSCEGISGGTDRNVQENPLWYACSYRYRMRETTWGNPTPLRPKTKHRPKVESLSGCQDCCTI